jgi:hypothetical protein
VILNNCWRMDILFLALQTCFDEQVGGVGVCKWTQDWPGIEPNAGTRPANTVSFITLRKLTAKPNGVSRQYEAVCKHRHPRHHTGAQKRIDCTTRR